ncbi:MAG: DNA polymerase III subunit delta [Pseudomonadota bacterium]
MAGDLLPEDVLKHLERGGLAPFYLFYGPDEFRLEKVLDRLKESLIPEAVRDFNLERFYGGENDPSEIINSARSLPFMSPNRLVIVRRTEKYTKDALNRFLPYLENPVESTCLIFIAAKSDAKIKFYKEMKSSGRAVQCGALNDRQLAPWIKRTAAEMGLNIEGQACAYLQQIVGNSSRNLYGELEKLRLRYQNKKVGPDEVRELVIHSRMYTIFEVMNQISVKNLPESLIVLNRFLAEEDKRAGPLKLLGMLNRQIRLLWLTKSLAGSGGRIPEISKKLGLPPFSAKAFIGQAAHWSGPELERGLSLLYEADGRLKSGSRPEPILENLFISLCDRKGLH